jgi:hypothetical protein
MSNQLTVVLSVNARTLTTNTDTDSVDLLLPQLSDFLVDSSDTSVNTFLELLGLFPTISAELSNTSVHLLALINVNTLESFKLSDSFLVTSNKDHRLKD